MSHHMKGQLEYTPIVPNFLKGKVDQRRMIEKTKQERPDRDDEAPTIVAEPEILELLSKQTNNQNEGLKGGNIKFSEQVVELGSKKRKKNKSNLLKDSTKKINTNSSEKNKIKKLSFEE